MFTGIIEDLGVITHLKKDLDNLHISLKSRLTPELKVDQSIAHNGVCLTVVNINGNEYTVTAIKETLDRSNLGALKINEKVNLERAMKLGDRLDGHIVQGHIDQTATCIAIEEANGSWVFTFNYNPELKNMTIEKGSITVNGISLTVVSSNKDNFSVAIIPYTFNHTNFKALTKGAIVNLEFDVLGKYVAKLVGLNVLNK